MTLIRPDSSRVWGIDISHWNLPPVDLKRMRDEFGLKFVIIKGHDGAVKTKYYEQHRDNALNLGLHWGIYDWLYPDVNVNINKQTDEWSRQYLADKPTMGVLIDAERTRYAGVNVYPNAIDLRKAHDTFRNKSGVKGVTYTSPGYAKEYLKGFDFTKEKLWIAHYGVLVPSLPAGATTYLIHQFTDNLDGKYLDPNGNHELDGNYYNGTEAEFMQEYGGQEVPPSDTVSEPYDGVRKTRGVRNGVKFYLNEYDPKKHTFKVVHGNPLLYPSDADPRADFFSNGNDWEKDKTKPNYQKPKGLSICNGDPYTMRSELEPALFFDDVPVYSTTRTQGQNAISGLASIVRGGLLPAYMFEPFEDDDRRLTYTETHARTAWGIKEDGWIMHLVVEGDYYHTGWTLPYTGQFLQEHGCVNAFYAGGGGDSIIGEKGVWESLPDDEINGVHFERMVPLAVLVYKREGVKMNKVTIVWDKGASVRPIPSINSTPTGIVLAKGDSYETDASVVDDRDDASNPDKKWIAYGNGFIATRFPSSSGLVERAKVEPLQEVPPDPEPTGEQFVANLTFKDDGTVSGTWQKA